MEGRRVGGVRLNIHLKFMHIIMKIFIIKFVVLQLKFYHLENIKTERRNLAITNGIK